MSAPYASTVLTGNDAGSIADRRPLLLAVLGASCISASAIMVTLAGTGAATTAFYRCALALPVLVTLALTERRRHGPRPWSAHRGAIAAGLLLAVDLVLWNHAIAEVGAGIATVLGNLQVLFVALAAWALFAERPGRRFLVVLPVVMVGVVMVAGLVGGGATGANHPLAGIGYGMGTSLAYAAFLLIFRRSSGGPHVAAPLAEATAGAALGALLFGLAFGELQLHISWQAFGWLLLLSLTSQTIGWLLITSSLPRLPAAVSSLTLLLQPAASMVLAYIVLREQPTIIQVAGAVVVCVGVLAASRSAPAPRDVPPSPAQLRQGGPGRGGVAPVACQAVGDS